MAKNVSVVVVTSNGNSFSANMKICLSPVMGRKGRAHIWVDKPSAVTDKITLTKIDNGHKWTGEIISKDKKDITINFW
jgi:hypothetical protein